MQIGVSVPNIGALASREAMVRFAEKAEVLGFDSLWVADHIVLPLEIRSRYPYASGGAIGLRPEDGILEPLATLCFLAGMTRRVRLGISVLVVPYRNPVLTAKILATLDVLSQGRVIYGAGIGWMQEEFEVMGASYDERGTVTEEYVQIFKELCTAERPSFQGKHYQFSGIAFSPKPVQKPHPPVWVGGITPPALRRAAWLGEGWHATRVSPEQMREYVPKLRQLRSQAGKDPDDFVISLMAGFQIQSQPLPEDGRIPLRGSPDQVLDDMRRYQEAGLQSLALGPRGRSLDEALSQLDRFVSEVRVRL